jgi:hypothetical protein
MAEVSLGEASGFVDSLRERTNPEKIRTLENHKGAAPAPGCAILSLFRPPKGEHGLMTIDSLRERTNPGENPHPYKPKGAAPTSHFVA